jgi:hypothetical protein
MTLSGKAATQNLDYTIEIARLAKDRYCIAAKLYTGVLINVTVTCIEETTKEYTKPRLDEMTRCDKVEVRMEVT